MTSKYEEEDLLSKDKNSNSNTNPSSPPEVPIENENENNDEELIQKICGWQKTSEELRSQYDQRWSKNIRLLKGIWDDDEQTKSKARNRSKLFFRKIWASKWRLLASLHSAFLKESLKDFKIEGREPEDEIRATVLEKMTKYRLDILMRKSNLFLKLIWSFHNICDMGIAIGKWRWKYNPSMNIDEPDFILYPNEQVYLDWSAETKDRMQYAIFENYMTKDEMEELSYQNIEEIKFGSVPYNIVRSSRYRGQEDPLQNPKPDEYPEPGKYEDGRIDSFKNGVARSWEVFYRKGGKIFFCVVSPESKKFLRMPIPSPYGDFYNNIVIGTCLTEAHKLIGEGFPEPLEGPQESLNDNINKRKDNIALALNKTSIVSRYGNVDLNSLVNSRPGGIILADDVNAVQIVDYGDVTKSAYVESGADEAMMQEMSGITPSKQGLGKEDKATVAQINLAEGNAKIDVFIAIVGNTFVQDFLNGLVFLIQRFETDKKIFRVANMQMQRQYLGMQAQALLPPIFIVDDFDADVVVNVGTGTVGRQQEIQQGLMAMDRAIVSNQNILALLQTGIIDPSTIKLFDVSAFMEDLLPKIGFKNISKYYASLTQAPIGGMPPEAGGGMNPAIAGRMQPQIGTMKDKMPPISITPGIGM